ncbi:MAG: ATP-binding protein, partial [Minisyncoccales bacterium]
NMIIKREIFPQLKNHLEKKEITLIIGPRQAGKTTLMHLLEKYLKSKGEQTLFLNLDVEVDKKYFSSQQDLIKKIELEFGKRKGFVFIDEIQRKEDAGIFLKGIYDLNLPYKFIVSGSGSLELKEKIHESLVGRKRIFELSTLTFEEFFHFKTDYKYYGKLVNFFEIEKDKGEELLNEYLNFGGYPKVVLEEKIVEKQRVMAEIYQSYLEKDISFLLRVKKTEAFSNLVKIAADQTGKLINLSELSSTLGISVKTVADYLWYLERTFIIKRVTPFFRNIRKEITKSPIVYFFDLGMRNFALGFFGKVELKTSWGNGFLFQNFVFNILREKIKNYSSEIHFWRTKDGGEVDFIIEKGREFYPLETKFKKLKEAELERSMRSFLKKYKTKKAYVVNLSLEK